MLGAVVSFLLTTSPVSVAVRGDCVDDQALRAALQAHVGVAVIDGDSSRAIEIAFDCATTNSVEVTLDLTIDGVPRGHRALGPFVDVDRAFDAAVLAASLVIDPLALDARSDVAPTPTPTPPEAPAPSPPTPTPTTAVGVARRYRIAPVMVGLALGGGVSGGLSPGTSPGLLARLHLEAGLVPLVIALGARVEAPPAIVLDGARQLVSTAGAFFVDGCYRQALIGEVVADLCVTGEGGVLRAYGEGFANAQTITARIMTLGATLSVRAPLLAGVGVFARASASSALVRARLLADDGEVVWTNPPIGGLFVVGVDGTLLSGGSPQATPSATTLSARPRGGRGLQAN